jgi:hypothetical protein
MKHKPGSTVVFAHVRILVFLSTLCFLCGKSSAQDFKQLYPGVEHAQVEHKIGTDPVKINLLRLDLKKVRLDVHHALDKAIGLETTSSIAKRKGAVAAINAGFFRLDKSEFAGENVGLLLINNKILSEPSMNRVAFGIANSRNRTEVSFNHYSYVGYLSWKAKKEIDALKGFNRQLKNDDLVAFTPEFGSRTPINSEALQVVVRKNRVVSVCAPECTIPKDGFVLSGSGNGKEFLRQLKPRDPISLDWDVTTEYKPNTFFPPEDIVAGVPQLIKNGKIDITWEQEKAAKAFVENRHPRTAVAKLKDGKFLMLTVDGRQPGVSVGMNLQELAEYLLSLGAVEAMNLDGGGSTTMYLDGKVVNTPSDKEGERKIGDAILVTLRRKK